MTLPQTWGYVFQGNQGTQGWKMYVSVALSLNSLPSPWEWEVGISGPRSLNTGNQSFFRSNKN